jgi:F-type H+-transporting ATPase subunit a
MIVVLPPLAAETIFHIGSFAVTNSYINGVLTTLALVALAFVIQQITGTSSWRQAPQGVLNFFEWLFEQVLTFMDQVTGNPVITKRAALLVIPLFFFILISNWTGLLPGIGSIGMYQLHEGHVELIPLFRPATSDLNMTVVMALTAVIVSHVGGIMIIGFWKYFNKFIKVRDLWRALISLSPVKIMVAAIEFIVGIIEIFSEIAKVASLSLRLFGNVFAGEVLLTVLAGLIPVLLPLPFIALELLVGIVQALVFSLLTLVYITMAMSEPHGAHADDGHNSAESAPAH